MSNPDIGLEALRTIRNEFHNFCKLHGSVSEADTRAKVIDEILHHVLFWPEVDTTREDHVDRGYMDYCLTVKNRRYVAVEAKRAGIPFTFPLDKHQRSLSLSGTLVTDPMIKETIEQVRGYCDDESIRYAVATNGYSWIVFRALREDMPWRKGRAVIFPSLEFIHDNFTYFWNLLSYVGISSGNLDNEFGVAHRAPRQLHRVV